MDRRSWSLLLALGAIWGLGDVRYWYQRDGRRIAKMVSFFLFAHVAGDPADHDLEVEEARWMALEEAGGRLTYPGERDMVVAAR